MLARTLTIALVLSASLAAADPAAEKLFEDGRTALAANQLDAACDAFRRSEALEPRIGTLLNLGDCEERRKHVATAWEIFIEAKTLAERARDGRASNAADRRARALAPRLPYLLIAVTRTEGLELQRDGVAVPEAAWDHEVPVDPKTFDLTARAPNHDSWTQRVTIIEGQHLRVEVPALAETAHEPTVTVAKPSVAVVVPPPPQPQPGPSPSSAASPSLDYHLAAGVFSAVTADTNWFNGGHVVWNVLALGPGALRLVPRLQYTSGDPNDPYHHVRTWDWSATIEYAYQALPHLLLAGGLGFGLDHTLDGYQVGTGNPDGAIDNQAAIVRIAPAFTYDRFALVFGYELERSGDSFHHTFSAGLDCFVW